MLEIVVICICDCVLHRPETFGRKHSLVAEQTVVKIISQFKAYSVTGLGHRGSKVRTLRFHLGSGLPIAKPGGQCM